MKRMKSVLVILAFLGLVLLATTFKHLPPLQAAPEATMLHVDSVTGSDNGSCGSTSQPCRTIQHAVNISNSGDTILVAAGTYTYSGSSTCLDGISTAVVCVLSKHLTILGGYTTSNWTAPNPTLNVTVVDGQNAHRGVQLHGPTANNASLRIEGFTIQNGLKRGATSGSDALTFAFGGGMLADRGSVIARNLIIKNNQALGGNTNSSYGGASGGGGMAFRANSNGVHLENIVFEGNLSQGGTGLERGGFGIGGGLYTLEAVVTGSDLTFINNTAQAGSSNGDGRSENNYADAQGGGAAFHNYSTVNIDTIVATGNQSIGGDAPNGDGGGAYGAALYGERATAYLSNLDVRNNLTQGGDGKDPTTSSSLANGGGWASSRSDVTLERATIVNNVARGGVGDIYWGAGGGAGVYFSGFAEDNTLTLNNVIIADNLAEMGISSGGTTTGGGGGGLFLNGGTANITHATFAQNRLGASPMQGNGIVVINGGTANITHSIIANHNSFTDAIAIHAQSGNNVNFNTNLLFGNNTNTGGGGTFTGSGSNLSGDPNFVAAGSPNFNYHINNGSAAIDKAVGSTTAVDVDNQNRAPFTPADLGADEYIPLYLYVLPNDHSLSLNWIANTALLPGLDHYEIVVSHGAGASPPNEGPSPIDVGNATNFDLTGLTNDASYTLTIRARNGSNSIIASSNTVTISPTDDLLYLPLVIK
ncbi:MAG: hypothetical protein CL608_06225 [Anaerolineaceae bacterium]|nr:hypothetical protein [Anaerolineaceae bacterium]